MWGRYEDVWKKVEEFYEEGERSPGVVITRLRDHFPPDKIPTWKAVKLRILKLKATRPSEDVEEKIEVDLRPVRPTEDEEDGSYIVEAGPQRGYSSTPPVKPPDLQYLVDQGIPRETALRLLVNWDMAVISGHDAYTRLLDKALRFFKEFPGIPYRSAMALAYLEEHATGGSRDEYTVAIGMAKRYRPWEGEENHRAMREAYIYWFRNVIGLPPSAALPCYSFGYPWDFAEDMWKRDLIKESAG